MDSIKYALFSRTKEVKRGGIIGEYYCRKCLYGW